MLHHHHRIAAPRGEARIFAVTDAETHGRVQPGSFHVRSRRELVAVADLAGAVRVEVLHHPAGVEPERYRHPAALVIDERQRISLALPFDAEHAIGIQTRWSPGLRRRRTATRHHAPFQSLSTHAGNVEQAGPGRAYFSNTPSAFSEANLATLLETLGDPEYLTGPVSSRHAVGTLWVRFTRRSVLVKQPSFSAHTAAGRKACAYCWSRHPDRRLVPPGIRASSILRMRAISVAHRGHGIGGDQPQTLISPVSTSAGCRS